MALRNHRVLSLSFISGAFTLGVLAFLLFFDVSDGGNTGKSSKKYDRESFRFVSYEPTSNIGFYTQMMCDTSIDHVVSLKDAFLSGAYAWSVEERAVFSNDRSNHVSACRRVNSSKAAAVPLVFISRSKDGKGLDYELVDLCGYLSIYYKVKITYGLSFGVNDSELFAGCGLDIKSVE